MEEPDDICRGLGAVAIAEETWTDVTALFRDAAAKIEAGQLLKAESFSLFEAMSAIELMDPKMDAGMVRAEKPHGFAKSVELGLLKIEEGDVSDEEMLRMMDATLGCFVSWLEGHSIVQTLYNNLLLHSPADIPARRLRVFAFAVLKLVALVKQLIKDAAVFEEEDFQAIPYRFEMGGAMERGKVFAAVKEIEDELQKAIRTFQRARSEGCAEAAVSTQEGLLTRFRLLRLLPLALLNMTMKESGRAEGGGVPRGQSLAEADRLLRQCEGLAERLSGGLTEAAVAGDGEYEGFLGFEPGVGAPLLPPTFPRKARIYNRLEAHAYLAALIQRLQLIVVLLPQHAASYGTALEMFRDFSKQKNCLLTRSVAQATYIAEGGAEVDVDASSSKTSSSPSSGATAGPLVLSTTSIAATILESIRAFINPPILQPKTPLLEKEESKAVWAQLQDEMAATFSDIIHVTGFNRARQREKLVRIMEELAQLHSQTERHENQLWELSSASSAGPPMSLRSFVLYHTLQVQLEYLGLGLELELYAPHELPYVYWYMGELVCKWLSNVVHKAANFLADQDHLLSKSEKKGKKSRKADKGRRLDNKLHRIEQVHWQTRQKICEAFFRMMAALEKSGLVEVGAPEGRRLRYEHRMSPFAALTYPPFVPFHQFLELSGLERELDEELETLGQRAGAAFEESRAMLERLPLSEAEEQSALLKICKNNAVVVKLLTSATGITSGKTLHFDFGSHKHYPLLKIVSKE